MEVLDISGGDLWLVHTTDPAEGRTAEGLVRRTWLTSKPPPQRTNAAPVQNATEPPRENGDVGIGEYVGRDVDKVQLRGHPPPTSSAPAAVLPGTLFGTYEPPKSTIFGKPEVDKRDIPIVEESVEKTTPITEQAPPLPPRTDKGVGSVGAELQRLQEASVSSQVQLDQFDPVELFVAIADFTAAEKSNISLRAGENVQVRAADSEVGPSCDNC